MKLSAGVLSGLGSMLLWQGCEGTVYYRKVVVDRPEDHCLSRVKACDTIREERMDNQTYLAGVELWNNAVVCSEFSESINEPCTVGFEFEVELIGYDHVCSEFLGFYFSEEIPNGWFISDYTTVQPALANVVGKNINTIISYSSVGVDWCNARSDATSDLYTYFLSKNLARLPSTGLRAAFFPQFAKRADSFKLTITARTDNIPNAAGSKLTIVSATIPLLAYLLTRS